MMQQDDLNRQQDVITLRLSLLSRSADFRENVLARLKKEDPFDMEDYNINNIEIGIVSQSKEVFAAKLRELLGSEAGDDYLEQENAITATGVQDTPGNREYIWNYWKQAAGTNSTLRPKKRACDEEALSQGTEVHFVGEYTGTGPDIELGEDGSGHPEIRFRNKPSVWSKLNP